MPLMSLAVRSPHPGGGLSRRDFIRICTVAAAAVGLSGTAAAKIAEAVAAGRKPSVIWLSFQECTGCTESLLRTSHPALDELILDLVSLDYHEALMAPSGHLAEEARKLAMRENAGKYILVVEGAIPAKDGGIYCKVGGQTAVDMLKEAAEQAGAIIAIGSCASFGGIPAADPNPTGATGAPQILEGKTVVTLPGCPANPYIFLGVALQYATFGTLPALDELGRPAFAYSRTIHEHCPRRPHFDAGRFAVQFGDEGHRQGWCLYQLGCKGPQTKASCSVLHFGDVVNAWPIGIGHPCFGCTEQKLAFRVPLFQTAEIERPMPPDTYPSIEPEQEGISPLATGVAGVVGGGLLGAGLVASRRLGAKEKKETAEVQEKGAA
jgi:hydrogenase small subunit